MARSARQSKILELISTKEIETQDELARELRNANFEITQATISRDIKELGLTKILTNSGKYKYAIVGSDEQQISNKFVSIFREAVISAKAVLNIVVVKTLKGMGEGVCSFIDKLNLTELVGAVNGDDTVMLIFPTAAYAADAVYSITDMLG
ncbi:MAG TPA: arginine repressor [Clostridiales bacterium]|nr:arginine repressor [Clostridiales bacterium]